MRNLGTACWRDQFSHLGFSADRRLQTPGARSLEHLEKAQAGERPTFQAGIDENRLHQRRLRRWSPSKNTPDHGKHEIDKRFTGRFLQNERILSKTERF